MQLAIHRPSAYYRQFRINLHYSRTLDLVSFKGTCISEGDRKSNKHNDCFPASFPIEPHVAFACKVEIISRNYFKKESTSGKMKRSQCAHKSLLPLVHRHVCVGCAQKEHLSSLSSATLK